MELFLAVCAFILLGYSIITFLIAIKEYKENKRLRDALTKYYERANAWHEKKECK